MTVIVSKFERKDNELYETEPWAVEALLRHINVDNLNVWEPSSGNHKIVDVLREHGAFVSTSDIVTYDREHHFIFDFLEGGTTEKPDAIITNPPYGFGNRDAVRYAELALQRCSGWVALLLTANFDFGKTRTHLFRDNPRFYAKIQLMDRISWAGNGKTGTTNHQWAIWGPDNYETKKIIWETKK